MKRKIILWTTFALSLILLGGLLIFDDSLISFVKMMPWNKEEILLKDVVYASLMFFSLLSAISVIIEFQMRNVGLYLEKIIALLYLIFQGSITYYNFKMALPKYSDWGHVTLGFVLILISFLLFTIKDKK